jgi:hypothetical protein
MSGTFKHTSSDSDGAAEVHWAPRLSRARLRRLYQLDALGVIDSELIDLVGHALEARCESILAVHDAQRGRVHCPRCAREDRTQLSERPMAHDPDTPFVCPACGWRTTWGAYRATYHRKQLNAGGAHTSFAAYLHNFRSAIGPRQKMLAIDRLIHEFHYSLRAQPDLPTRPAGVNLIEGSMSDVVAFLEELAYGVDAAAPAAPATPETRVTAETWRQNEQRRRAQWSASPPLAP